MKKILAAATAAVLLITGTSCSGFLDEELKKEVKEFDFTSYNASINVEIKRGTVTEKNMHLYHTLIDDGAGKTSAAMAKEITRRIKDQQQGGKLDGMYNGRYLDRNHLYRFDRKIFCKNDLPEDIPPVLPPPLPCVQNR